MNRWLAATCRANGINIHYLRTGGNHPPVVLLHGLTMNGACWTSLARALEAEYDVVMPDARGHGNSSAPDHGYSYNELATDVLSLIDALKLKRPVLIGHSMGGMTAAVAASTASHELRRIVLADPTFLTPQRQQEVYASHLTVAHQDILNRSKEDFLAELRGRYPNRHFKLIEQIVQARFQTSRHAFDILTPPNPDYRQLIGALTIPSLLVIGGARGVVSVEVAAELAKLNQRLKVVQIKEAGHGIPYDQPEHFSAAVKAFLKTEDKDCD